MCVKCQTRIKSRNICFTFCRQWLFCGQHSAQWRVSALMRNFWSSNTFSLELNYSELFWLQPFSKTNDGLCFFSALFRSSKWWVRVWIGDSRKDLEHDNYKIPFFTRYSLQVIFILLWFDWIDSARWDTQKKNMKWTHFSLRSLWFVVIVNVI